MTSGVSVSLFLSKNIKGAARLKVPTRYKNPIIKYAFTSHALRRDLEFPQVYSENAILVILLIQNLGLGFIQFHLFIHSSIPFFM